jgi:putative acetyltransferase
MVTVRPEKPTDHRAVYAVNQAAFGRDNEARLVEALRVSPVFVPELSLVALDDLRVVGHILFTRIVIRSAAEAHRALALAPMAVLPADQKRGISWSTRPNSIECRDSRGGG